MAVIRVRPHGLTAAALLALSAVLALLSALRVRWVPADLSLLALLGGLTLLAQAVAYWYLPSFAKREVILDGMASYAGPILFPAALVAAALRSGAARGTMLALGLGLFALVPVVSAAFGPRWRGGTAFWRTGEHRRGDLLAMLTFLTAFIWSAAAAACALLAPPGLVVAWPTALALFALAALVHLLPRLRGRAAVLPLFAAGVAAANVGAALSLAVRLGKPLAPLSLGYALMLGFVLAALALAPPWPRPKAAGPRMRDARPLLLGALLLGALALAALVPQPMPLGRARLAYATLMVAVALAVGAVAILGLPVVFNAVPDHRFVWPAAALAVLGVVFLAGERYTGLAPWRGTGLLAGAMACYLAAMWPLRSPRRECPPE